MLLEDASTYLATRLAGQTAVAVVYNRQGDFGAESAPITATRGSTPYEAANEDGIVTRWETRDYITAAASFPFSEPIDGDTITDAGRTYQVQSLPGQRPFRYCDPGRALMRIHCKLTALEPS